MPVYTAKRGIPGMELPRMELFWHYYLIQPVGHLCVPARVEVAISFYYHLYGISNALGNQVRRISHFNQQTDVGMSQIVDAYSGDSCLFRASFYISPD